jgi:thiol:disulfide interchange protein DsbD
MTLGFPLIGHAIYHNGSGEVKNPVPSLQNGEMPYNGEKNDDQAESSAGGLAMVRIRKGRLFAFLLLLILGQPLLHSEEELVEIKAYISRNAVHRGEEFKVALQVRIKEGWHINANKAEDELLIPTSFSFDTAEGIQVVESYYSEPERGRFEYSESDQSYYQGEVLFGARVQVDADVPLGKSEMSAKLRYQACDDRSCAPPRTISLLIPFEVVPTAEETRDTHPEIFAKIKFTKREGGRP